MRIGSLLASATEILCGLGLADNLVGISHDCDYPTEIQDRPRLTRSRLRSDLRSRPYNFLSWVSCPRRTTSLS